MIAQQVALTQLFSQWLEPPYQPIQNLEVFVEYEVGEIIEAVGNVVFMGMLAGFIGIAVRAYMTS